MIQSDSAIFHEGKGRVLCSGGFAITVAMVFRAARFSLMTHDDCSTGEEDCPSFRCFEELILGDRDGTCVCVCVCVCVFSAADLLLVALPRSCV